jgi:hypothetical protein
MSVPSLFDTPKGADFFRHLSARFPRSLKVHDAAGHFGEAPLGDKMNDWSGLVPHCLLTSALARVLGEALGLGGDTVAEMELAGILHDCRKRGEVEETLGCTSNDPVAKAYAKSADYAAGALANAIEDIYPSITREERAPAIARVSRLMGAFSHLSLPLFTDTSLTASDGWPLRAGVPIDLLAMHYLDVVVHRAGITDNIDNRIGYFKERYTYGADGQALWGANFFDVEKVVSNRIEGVLAHSLGVANPKDLPGHLGKLLSRQIDAVAQPSAA